MERCRAKRLFLIWAGKLNIGPERISLLMASTESPVGTIQMVGRALEVALHQVVEQTILADDDAIEFNPRCIRYGYAHAAGPQISPTIF